MTYRKWNGGGGNYRFGEDSVKSNENLIQQIDGATGEITRTAIIHKDEQFVVRKKTDGSSEYCYHYPKEYAKIFPVGKAFGVFRRQPNLYFYAAYLAQWLKEGTGILWRVNEPYAWRHFGVDMNFDHTTLYRIKRKLVAAGIVGVIRYFGQRCIILNPFLFGKGDRCLKVVSQYFSNKEIFKRWNDERKLGKKR